MDVIQVIGMKFFTSVMGGTAALFATAMLCFAIAQKPSLYRSESRIKRMATWCSRHYFLTCGGMALLVGILCHHFIPEQFTFPAHSAVVTYSPPRIHKVFEEKTNLKGEEIPSLWWQTNFVLISYKTYTRTIPMHVVFTTPGQQIIKLKYDVRFNVMGRPSHIEPLVKLLEQWDGKIEKMLSYDLFEFNEQCANEIRTFTNPLVKDARHRFLLTLAEFLENRGYGRGEEDMSRPIRVAHVELNYYE